MSSKSSWKDALLASGLPLEVTVTEILSQREWFVHGETEFPAFRDDGSRMLRSIDIEAWQSAPLVNLALLIECKYRRDGKQWVFAPPHAKEFGKRQWITNCLVSPFVPPWYSDSPVVVPPTVQFAHRPAADDAHLLPVATKGVELIPENSDGKMKTAEASIKNAIRQVQYACTYHQSCFTPMPRAAFEDYLYGPTWFRFLLPMVVTTADLLILSENSSIERIRSAHNIEDVAQHVGAVIVGTPLGQDLLSYARALLKNNLDWLLSSPWTSDDAQACQASSLSRSGKGQSDFMDAQPRTAPSQFLVVRLDRLSGMIEDWQRLFSDPGQLAPFEHLQGKLATGIAYDVKEHARRSKQTTGK